MHKSEGGAEGRWVEDGWIGWKLYPKPAENPRESTNNFPIFLSIASSLLLSLSLSCAAVDEERNYVKEVVVMVVVVVAVELHPSIRGVQPGLQIASGFGSRGLWVRGRAV